MAFSPKQLEYFQKATHRWNVKSGATRSGKTYMDYFVIPKRIRAVAGKAGLVFFLGNTKGTLQRNIIMPLQNIWGTELVGNIRQDNTADIFGETVICLGCDKNTAVDRLRGSSIKYCYGDEVVTWNKEVFDMLKSRLDKSYSCFDGACNPKDVGHWFNKFIRRDADIFLQEYTLYDNPFNPPEFVKNLENEYKGTVFFDRYILGRWVNAEGIIYRQFADNTDMFLIDPKSIPSLQLVVIGLDYGAGQSKTSMKAIGFSQGFKAVYVLAEEDLNEVYDPDSLYRKFHGFYQKVIARFNKCQFVYGDWGGLGNTLNKGLYVYCKKNHIPITVRDCSKGTILERIELTQKLMAERRLFVSKECKNMIKAFQEAVWNDKKPDERLDDGTSDVDSLDAFEYALYPYENYLMKGMIYK